MELNSRSLLPFSPPQVHSFAADLREYVAEALGENVPTDAVTCIYRLADASRTNLRDVASACPDPDQAKDRRPPYPRQRAMEGG